MTTLKLCMLALTGVAAATVVRHWRGDWMPLLRTALAIVLAIGAISTAAPLVVFLSDLIKSDALAAHATLLLKALGIAVLTQCCSTLCRECGESAVGNGVELIGKIEILLLALPMITDILEVARTLLSMGGS